MTLRDLAIMNRADVLRVVNTGSVDFATGPDDALGHGSGRRSLRDESPCRPRRAQNRSSNPNEIYDVALNPLFPRKLKQNPLTTD